MKKPLISLLSLALSAHLGAAAFTPGNVTVLRIGNGTGALSNACTALFVEEFTPAGAAVQTIALPTSTAGARICLSGTATSEGLMTRTVDTSALLVAGYDAVLGSAGVATAAAVNRVVAIINADGTVTISSGFIDGYLTNNVRGAAGETVDRFYLSGTGSTASGGSRLLNAGDTTTTQLSTSVTNTRGIAIFGGQLYTSSGSGAFRVASVGAGLPSSSGQTTSNLPGFPTATTSPYQFHFADLDAGVAGVDTLWVANDDASALAKHSLVAGLWASNGNIGAAADGYRGLTLIGSTLYVSNRSSLRTLTAGGYNAALSGSPSAIVSAAANTAFQGVAPAPQGLPVLSINSPSVTEGNTPTNTPITFTASLNFASASNCTFNIESFIPTPGPGIAVGGGVDYAFSNIINLSIPAGQTSVTFDATVIGDNAVEGDETFPVSAFGEPLTCDISNANGTGTIIDDDGVATTATIAIDSLSQAEGNAGSGPMTFSVTRSNNTTAFTVPVTIATTSATLNSDFTGIDTTLNFAAGGALSQTVTMTILGDSGVETDEQFQLNLGVVTNTTGTTTISTGVGVGTIVNDDASILISSFVAAPEGNAGASNLNFTATRSGLTSVAHSFDFATNGSGTATSGLDYTASNGSVNFAIGVTTQSFSIAINAERIWEDSEQFGITFSNASVGATLGTLSAVGQINNDDLPNIEVSDISIAEGNTGTSNAVLNLVAVDPVLSADRNLLAPVAPLGTPNVVNLSFASTDGSATAGLDYTTSGGNLQFTPSNRTRSVSVPILGDTLVEGNETLNVNFTVQQSGIVVPADATAVITITDDDQQSTLATIISDQPDASVVGQSYLVAVAVSAPVTSPIGDVIISDGAASCSFTLMATTAPNSSGSCNLTSTSAGTKTLTANYVPASSAFTASSANTTHQVNPATTTLTASGPVRVRINQPASYSVVLAVDAPGAGAPSGTVTLSSGAFSCTVSLPSATPSCNLSFNTLGPKVINASFVPTGGDFLGASAIPVNTLVFAQADLAVTKDNGVSSYRVGDLLVYTLILRNNGPDFAPGVRFNDVIPASLFNPRWTCAASAGAICPEAGGVLDINAAVSSLPSGAALTYTLSAMVPRPAPTSVVNRAEVFLPANNFIEDLVLSNQSQTDTDTLQLVFAHSFEAPSINQASGSFVIPSGALRGYAEPVAKVVYRLDDALGEALRVYSRTFEGELEFALATRDASGLWTLQEWKTYATEPQLSWTAQTRDFGYVLTAARLQ